MSETTKDDGAETDVHHLEPEAAGISKQQLGASAGSHGLRSNSGAAGICGQRLVDSVAVGTENQEGDASASSHHRQINSEDAGSSDPVKDGAVVTVNQEVGASAESNTPPHLGLSIYAEEFHPRQSSTSPSPVTSSSAATSRHSPSQLVCGEGEHFTPAMGYRTPHLQGYGPVLLQDPESPSPVFMNYPMHPPPMAFRTAPQHTYPLHTYPPSPPYQCPPSPGYDSRAPSPPYDSSASLYQRPPSPAYGSGGSRYQRPPSPAYDSRGSRHQRPPSPPYDSRASRHQRPLSAPYDSGVSQQGLRSSPPTHQGGSKSNQVHQSYQAEFPSDTHHQGSSGHHSSSQSLSATGRQGGSGRRQSSSVPSPPIFEPPSMPVRPSFASTALYGSSTAAELESIENKLVGFLMKDESYKNQALCPTGPRLQINFNELVYHDKALAMRVCNEQGTSEYWLRGAASKFCKESGATFENASIEFKNLPYRINYVKETLDTRPRSQRVSLCGNRSTHSVATAHGREHLRIIVWDSLDLLLDGESFDGELTVEDLMFVQLTEDPKSKKLLIARRPCGRKKEDPRHGIKPLQEIWTAVEPSFKDVHGRLPLYFTQLKRDLSCATELDAEFVEYVRYHPAFCSSMGRKILIDGIHQSRKDFNLERSEAFGNSFTEEPYPTDWNEVAKRVDILRLLHEFQFEGREHNRTNKVQQGKVATVDEKGSQNMGKVEMSSEKLQKNAEAGAATSGPDGKKAEEGVDQDNGNNEGTRRELASYINTSWSLLAYNRNGHTHLGQYVKVRAPEEVELYLASIFEDFLPNLIKKLISVDKMCGIFASAWSAYKACIFDGQEPPKI